MKVSIKVPTYTIGIDLAPAFVKDLLPLLRQAGGNDAWCLQQRQTFNSLAGKLEEAMKAASHIDAKSVLL